MKYSLWKQRKGILNAFHYRLAPNIYTAHHFDSHLWPNHGQIYWIETTMDLLFLHYKSTETSKCFQTILFASCFEIFLGSQTSIDSFHISNNTYDSSVSNEKQWQMPHRNYHIACVSTFFAEVHAVKTTTARPAIQWVTFFIDSHIRTKNRVHCPSIF